jgi:hypothetical protein
MRWVSCLLVICLAGCDDVPQAAIDEDACSSLCRCVAGSPSSQETCTNQCIAVVAPVSSACATCTATHANTCASMIADCEPLCQPRPNPTP